MNQNEQSDPNVRFESASFEGCNTTFHSSTESRDSDWDEFLERASQGHFQQSSAWAAHKGTEGWRVIRTVIRESGHIVGGFQILWKEKSKVRIGYISKGPIAEPPSERLFEQTIASIKETARGQNIAALVVQPADNAPEDFVRLLEKAGFIPSPFLGIISATILIDLAKPQSEIEERFRKNTRKSCRRAIRHGLKIESGDSGDIPEFFELMKQTCLRQGTVPNPSSLDSMQSLWTNLNSDRNRAYLKFARFEGKRITGQLIIVFGKRASLFKTGWDGSHRSLRPNNLLVRESILWAAEQGCHIADFVSFDRDMADTMLRRGKISPEQNQLRDAFKAGFGGCPKQLPTACVWITNPAARLCFKWMVKIPLIRNRLSKIVG